jgi:hypothetical protein
MSKMNELTDFAKCFRKNVIKIDHLCHILQDVLLEKQALTLIYKSYAIYIELKKKQNKVKDDRHLLTALITFTD